MIQSNKVLYQILDGSLWEGCQKCYETLRDRRAAVVDVFYFIITAVRGQLFDPEPGNIAAP